MLGYSLEYLRCLWNKLCCSASIIHITSSVFTPPLASSKCSWSSISIHYWLCRVNIAFFQAPFSPFSHLGAFCLETLQWKRLIKKTVLKLMWVGLPQIYKLHQWLNRSHELHPSLHLRPHPSLFQSCFAYQDSLFGPLLK